MDYADENHTTDRWSRHGLPTTADGSPSSDDEASASGADPDRASDADGRDPDETRASVTHGFLVELAKAMHAAADQERERLAVAVAEDGAAHVERARARAAVEAEELRRIADEDLDRISDWSASEIERIHGEAARRAAERRSALDDYIRRHEAIIDTEIQGVASALAEYHETLQQFFSELTASTDPAEIARRAGTLPQPPDLDEVRANARATAVGRFAQETAQGDASDGDDDASTAEAVLGEAAESEPATDQAPTGDTEIAGAPDVSAPLIGVMDPVAARQSGPPDVLMPVETAEDGAGEASAEDSSIDPTPAGAAEDEREPASVAAGSSTERISAVRLLRTIAPWTAPSDHLERRVVDDTDEDHERDNTV